MISVKRLGHATLTSPDIERQIAYYTEVIGLTLVERGKDRAYLASRLGLEAVALEPGRINALGALIAVYFLATGTAGLELLGAQTYDQQIFYGAALVAAVTIPKVNRERIFKRRRTA